MVGGIKRVPRRIFDLYEAVYAYPQEICDMTDEALEISRTASEADHHDDRCFGLLY